MLKNEIDAAKRSVNTDMVQVTIGEMANMYNASELNILPEFQRLFRWSLERKSSLVESILIGIPVPPVFAFEKEDGTWELIDGLQRISTVLEFMGVLKDPDSNECQRSTLLRTKYLQSLQGVVWKKENDDEIALDKALQLFFRRYRINFQILKHPSDPKTKFDLFQRLNRGGAYANEQEVRTCSMVLANADFTKRLRVFSDRKDFTEICNITPDQRARQDNLAFLVRLVVLTYEDFPRRMDVQEFLDQGIIKVMEYHSTDEVMSRITWTVETLSRLFGANALKPPEDRVDGISPRFSLRALAGIAVGLSRNKNGIIALSDPDKFIQEKVAAFWMQPEVPDMSSPGLRGSVRIERAVPFGIAWFNPNA